MSEPNNESTEFIFSIIQDEINRKIATISSLTTKTSITMTITSVFVIDGIVSRLYDSNGSQCGNIMIFVAFISAMISISFFVFVLTGYPLKALDIQQIDDNDFKKSKLDIAKEVLNLYKESAEKYDKAIDNKSKGFIGGILFLSISLIFYIIYILIK